MFLLEIAGVGLHGIAFIFATNLAYGKTLEESTFLESSNAHQYYCPRLIAFGSSLDVTSLNVDIL